MRRGALVSLSAAAFIFSVHVATADAQHGHATAHPVPSPHPAAPPQAHGGGSHASSAHGGASHASTHATSHSSVAHASHTTTTTKTTRTTTSTTTLTPVQQKLVKNTNLASKLQSRLPAGTDLQAAAAGFRNLGQFVAAVNVSHNLGIPFVDLKRDMVTRGMSLGQSIQDLRPTVNATTETQHAERDADVLIRRTESTTTTTTSRTKSRTHGTHGD